MRLRFTLRALLVFVAISACILAWVLVPIRTHSVFWRLRNDGKTAIQTYYSKRPPDIKEARWRGAVNLVNTAWGDVVSYPGVIEIRKLETAVEGLEARASKATPEGAAQDLFEYLNLMESLRPDKRPYVEFMRSELHDKIGNSNGS